MAKRGRPKKPEVNYEKIKNTDPAELSHEELLQLAVYLQAENEYLKRLKALVESKENNNKNPK